MSDQIGSLRTRREELLNGADGINALRTEEAECEARLQALRAKIAERQRTMASIDGALQSLDAAMHALGTQPN